MSAASRAHRPGPPASNHPDSIRSMRPNRDWSADEIRLRQRLEAGETVVVTLRGPHDTLIRWASDRGLYVRVDRNTIWGNPFKLGRDGDRAAVIAKYEQQHLPRNPLLLNRLPDLRGKALGCWCAPKPCHADVLKRWADGGGA